jgi:hypothetical protein
MWAQGHKEYSTWSFKRSLLGQSSRALTSEICVSSAYKGKLLVEGMISTVRRTARAHCLSNRLNRRAVCWMTLTPSASGVDRTH